MIQNPIGRRNLRDFVAGGDLGVPRSRFRAVVFMASLICLGLAFAGCSREEAATTETAAKDIGLEAPPEAPPEQAGQKPAEAPPQAPPAAPRPGQIAAPADVAAPPADAQTTATGLASKVLQVGQGTTHPEATSMVRVHYTGWTTDGKMFDSSVARGEPITFPLNRVIPGWTEGVQLMVVGEKRRLWIPQELAYKGQSGRPAGMLVFDVELLDVTAPPKPPTVPADVAAPPADAVKTASGLASKVLAAGTGTEHPQATSRVVVHYSGWTTDGKLFDSSILRGQPADFSLNQVIPGWTEGVQLMVVGEQRRFWIPQALAYKGQSGAPAGMLVFDVNLIAIK